MALGAMQSAGIAIAQKNIGPWFFKQHIGEIFCAHRGLYIPLHHVLAHNLRCHISRKHRLGRMINCGRIVPHKRKLGMGIKAGGS